MLVFLFRWFLCTWPCCRAAPTQRRQRRQQVPCRTWLPVTGNPVSTSAPLSGRRRVRLYIFPWGWLILLRQYILPNSLFYKSTMSPYCTQKFFLSLIISDILTFSCQKQGLIKFKTSFSFFGLVIYDVKFLNIRRTNWEALNLCLTRINKIIIKKELILGKPYDK